MIKCLSVARKFRSYYGLKGAESKLRRWLSDFQFVDIETADRLLDWSSVQRIEL